MHAVLIGAEVSGSQDWRHVRAEGHPQPEALPQAGPGGDQDPRAPAQPGHPFNTLTPILAFASPSLQLHAHPP